MFCTNLCANHPTYFTRLFFRFFKSNYSKSLCFHFSTFGCLQRARALSSVTLSRRLENRAKLKSSLTISLKELIFLTLFQKWLKIENSLIKCCQFQNIFVRVNSFGRFSFTNNSDNPLPDFCQTATEILSKISVTQ